MRQRLFTEILRARERVYEVGSPTPLEVITLGENTQVFLKREDQSDIHAYKWRGAYNRMSMMNEADRERGVVAASAGNHAQGVAVASQKLGLHSRIYMPHSTPRMKQQAVKKHGGDRVEVILHGDDYSVAAAEALEYAAQSGITFIHPYDDLGTMGGQGTIADEVVMSGQGPFDVAYIQIGGGGLAASMACWLKYYYPNIKIIGVEGVEQASMAKAIEVGHPVELEYIDVFCDGTAVKKTGELTYPLCAELLDEYMTVTNEEVCAAIQVLWETRRCIAEPAGAMGLAGILKHKKQLAGQRALCVIAGSNMDFGQLAWVGRHADIGVGRRRYFRFEIGERAGGMLDLLEASMDGLNIIEFQYGKVDVDKAWPVIGVEASPIELDLLDQRLTDLNIPHEEVTSEEDVEFRIIHYEANLFSNPYFFKLEFPERAGALHDFLTLVRGAGNMCYFNYASSGEQVGRAMLGFEFQTQDERARFLKLLSESHHVYQSISEKVLHRVL